MDSIDILQVEKKQAYGILAGKSKTRIPKRLQIFLKQQAIYAIAFISIVVILGLLRINIVSIILIFILIIIASFSKIYKRITSLSLGIEVVTSVSIMFAYKYGIIMAVISNIFMLLAAGFISGRVEFTSIFSQALVYIVTIFLASSFSALDFTTLSIWLIVIHNLAAMPVDIILTGRNFIHAIIISIGAIITNIAFTLVVGKRIIGLI